MCVGVAGGSALKTCSFRQSTHAAVDGEGRIEEMLGIGSNVLQGMPTFFALLRPSTGPGRCSIVHRFTVRRCTIGRRLPGRHDPLLGNCQPEHPECIAA